MKRTIVIDMPGGELLAGLAAFEVFPALKKAEAAVAEATAKLAKAREDIERRQGYAADLPAQVAAGQRPAGELEAALRALAAELRVLPEHEGRLADAQAELSSAQKAAQLHVAEEVTRRAARLQDVADQLAPTLTQLAEMAVALGRIVDPDPYAGPVDVHWPSSPMDEVPLTNAQLAAGGTALGSAGFKSWAEAQHGVKR